MPVTEDTRIYLDQSQCSKFSTNGADAYFDGGEVVVAASTLLNSKPGGYDRAHKDVLEPLGHKTVVLSREESDSPGWFGIKKVI